MPSPGSRTELDVLRGRYQKGVLAWLRPPAADAGEAGLARMTKALEALYTIRPRPFLAAALSLFAAIGAGKLMPGPEHRRLAGRVDLALKRLHREESAPEEGELLEALRAPLAALEASMPRAILRDPLSTTLAATSSLLPLIARPREPRFTTKQRGKWDHAVHALALAWNAEPKAWPSLRRAVFKLLDGALDLGHPALLRLAEALASATDGLEAGAADIPPRRLTALAATLELIPEQDFLEHEALEERTAQLVARLESEETGPRSQAVDRIFQAEAADELESMRLALEALPPNTEAIAEAACQLHSLAEAIDLSALAASAAHFADTIATLDPCRLDRAPERASVFAWIATMEAWIDAVQEDEAASTSFPERLARCLGEIRERAAGIREQEG
ncbi:MAG: hypothetical protein LBO00_03110 [Zoogloeaceae bacterium]|jgi:HPt (histidine-containing phosphotransfer) domain-containing protein|nr:hypothetical protein [Zoogloeaceae bacterium]